MIRRNRYYDTYIHALAYGVICVFISHQKCAAVVA